MIPLRIAVKGFMTYRDEQVFDFSQAPLWVLAGPNGAGKSAIFDAITFALYDHHRGGGQNARDLINHHCDALAVEFDFLVDDEAYRVRRTVSRRGRPTRQACRLSRMNGSEPYADPVPDTESDRGFNTWVADTIGLDYEAFTSSILLLQGQSDKLLDAKPRDRDEILCRLIDMAPYQALHQRADDQRRQADAQVKAHKMTLAGLSDISDDELAARYRRRDELQARHEQLQRQVEHLAARFGQAKAYAELGENLVHAQEELCAAQALLAQTDRIEQGHTRWQELNTVLPDLRQIASQRGRLADATRCLTDLEATQQTLRDQAQAAEGAALAAREHSRRLTAAYEQVQQGCASAAEEDHCLQDLVKKLDEAEKVVGQVNTLDTQLAALPPDLADQLQAAETRDAALAELERALPWLSQVAETRAQLEAGLAESERLAEETAQWQADLAATEALKVDATRQVEAAQAREAELGQAVARVEERYRDAQKRRQRFEKVSEQPTCDLCGQPITADHVALERIRLDEQQVARQAEWRQQQTLQQQATDERAARQAELTRLIQECERKANGQREVGQRLGRAQHEVGTHRRQLWQAWDNLPRAYQAHISSERPVPDAAWLATIYPTAEDLALARREVKQRRDHARHLAALRARHADWRTWTEKRELLCQQLGDLQAAPPTIDKLVIRAQAAAVHAEWGRLTKAVSEARAAANTAQAAAEDAAREVQRLTAKVHQGETQRAGLVASSEEIQRRLADLRTGLPEAWRVASDTLSRDGVVRLTAEAESLKEMPEQYRALLGARASVATLGSQVERLAAQRDTYRDEARWPVADLEQALRQTRQEQDQADAARQGAHTAVAQMENDQARYREAQQRLQAAERCLHLYTLLATLLGPRNLQRHLLRKAERAIVDLANETLHGLSRGTLRLELRQPDGDGDQALDLVVHNDETGSPAMPVAMVSGSQKFRLAVSLALAIGRYASQEARRIESVIIDEGFGSLDKQGRDDMIRELDHLQERLKRILLVSHQEEFAQAFTNGYAIELVDGASRVSTLERW